ncbi:peptide-methionine (S)-S-oxide reductase MsrA [Segniliparus rugosus]|uniref:Peptide methionine sulfoxide reductase MsrA n=1 Tax=Segniliparus rugosus (strain ATCC BAA-974 / DSM 45345 / CCUG 50838 / CIP 108380 / JCM 13579 / CDC 945) TaxID=679197 RepID=E5XUX2_SEGRC|nr:peptide-methionine (S)-S-oxide reductase [Segniliparus rugosus ATCC BAA-974]
MALFSSARVNAKLTVISPEDALAGSAFPVLRGGKNFLNGAPLDPLAPSDHGPRNPQWPQDVVSAVFGGGCFWGFEKAFWSLPGVFTTAVGYAGGTTVNPGYKQVCSGRTGHAEVVLVAFHPDQTSYQDLLATFWESHDPTQGMRQGADIGTQYRSVILTTGPEQQRLAEESQAAYQQELGKAGYGPISTEIRPLVAPSATDTGFYLAEEDHQQYLAKNPAGYCGHGGTGVSCPIGLRRQQA